MLRWRFGGKEIAGQKVGASARAGPPAAAAGRPYLDFGARFYDPRTAAWLSQDPLSEKYYPISPYAYCAGNPVNLVDPTGKDIWEVDENGFLRWCDWHYENRLYVVRGGERSSSFITISDESIFYDLQMPKETNNEATGMIINSSTRNEKQELFKVFKYVADNTDVEWVIHHSDKGYTLGTIHNNKSSGSYSDYGLMNVDISLHSHPGGKYQNTKEAIESMGYDYPTYTGALYKSDWYNVINDYNENGRITRQNLVYFPITGSVYKVGLHRPLFQKNVSSFKQLLF